MVEGSSQAEGIGVGPEHDQTLSQVGGHGRIFSLGVVLSLIWLVLLVMSTLLAPLLPLRDPVRDLDFTALASPPTIAHPLGTDALGRDVLARLVAGARVALIVSIGSVLLGATIGTVFGLLSGHFGGVIDAITVWLTDSILAFPALILAIALVVYVGPDVRTVTIAIGIVSLPTFARIARAATLGFAQREFVLAAKSIGLSDLEILRKELLPNVAIPVGTFMLLMAALAIVTEGALGYLGLSVAPPAPTWGGMIASGRPMLQSAPHLSLFPAVAIFLTVISLNTLGRKLQRHFDIRTSTL